MDKLLLASFFVFGGDLTWIRERIKPQDFKLDGYAAGEEGQLHRGVLGKVEFQLMPRLIIGGKAYQGRNSFGRTSEYVGYGLTNFPHSRFKDFLVGAGLVELSSGRHEFSAVVIEDKRGQVDIDKSSRTWGPVLRLEFSRIVKRVEINLGFNYHPHLFRADRLEEVSITNFGHRMADRKEAGNLSGFEVETAILFPIFIKKGLRSGISGGWHWRNLDSRQPFSVDPSYRQEKKVLLGWGFRF